MIVVGGGISGLAAARAAVEALQEEPGGEVLVLEAAAEVGGKVRSLRQDGWLLEAGPGGFLDNEPEIDRLVSVAGLEKLPAERAAAHRFVALGGKLREIHAHPLRFARSGILSPLGLLRVLREPWIPRRIDDADESVYDFGARRLGHQAAQRLIQPMVQGIYAGDAHRLSLPAAFPRMRELEREFGSLFRALAALKRRGAASGGPSGPAGWLTSFEHGLQSLPLRLAERGGFAVRRNAPVVSLAAQGGRWRVATAEGSAHGADALVLAVPASELAELLEPLAPAAARALAEIRVPPVAVCGLGYGPEALAAVPNGFGALVARSEGRRALGVLWESRIFRGRAPEGRLLVRAVFGGALDEEIGALDDESLLGLAREDVARLLGLQRPPIFERVVRWERAIPQYEIGHLERVERVRREAERLSHQAAPLALAGNWKEGVAFGKAAASGARAGREAIDMLRALRS